MIMALKASDIPFEVPRRRTAREDYLARLLDEPDVHAKLQKEYPTLAGRPPQEVHAILSWAVNEKLVKRRVTMFGTRVSMQENYIALPGISAPLLCLASLQTMATS